MESRVIPFDKVSLANANDLHVENLCNWRLLFSCVSSLKRFITTFCLGFHIWPREGGCRDSPKKILLLGVSVAVHHPAKKYLTNGCTNLRLWWIC